MKGIQWGICALVKGYQRVVSPVLHWACGPGAGCRFTPTCSEYCLQAVRLHGVSKGLQLGLKRVCRCHPWGAFGFDPVPLPLSLSERTYDRPNR